MEQLINNNLLANMQFTQTAQTGKKNESLDKDGFQKLMEQKTDTASGSPRQERTDAAQKPQDSQKTEEVQESQQVQAAPKSEKELEDQMALAAIAMLQNPVVPVEQVMTPEVQAETVAVDAAPLMAEVVVTPELQEAVPEVEAPVEVPVEAGEVQTESQVPVEDVPQPIEAPEVPQGAEERTVEVKVETAEAPQESETEDTPELQDAEVETPVFENVKAVPVKVGEAPRTEQPKPVEEQIVPKLTEALQNGETRVELQLTPENLGKVTIEMTLKQDGGLVVQIHAENRDTQNLLSKNLSGLEALLGRQTEQEVRVEVPRQEESQRQDLYEQQQEHHRRQQQERRSRREGDSEAFMQQLRLGLIPMDEE